MTVAAIGPPWPLSERTPWDGVQPLPGGHRLTISADGEGRTRQWWHLPEPDLSIDEGAERVAAALHDAVAARTAGAVPVCADLSGGMDSTSLAFIASETPAPLVTVHREPLGAANDDSEWADRCPSTPARRKAHITIRRGAGPHLYSGLASNAVDLENARLGAATDRARDHMVTTAKWSALARVAAGLATQLAFLSMLGVGGVRVAVGELEVSSLIADAAAVAVVIETALITGGAVGSQDDLGL